MDAEVTQKKVLQARTEIVEIDNASFEDGIFIRTTPVTAETGGNIIGQDGRAVTTLTGTTAVGGETLVQATAPDDEDFRQMQRSQPQVYQVIRHSASI